MEEETQRQGGFDREVRVLRWRAPRARSLRFPGCDGCPGQPDCDVAPTDQGSLVGRPVSDAVFRLVFRMDSRLHPSSLVWVPLNLTLDLCNNAHTPSQVVLGGRKVAIRRPRARRAGEEVPLPPARAFANADPLNRRVVDQMLIGVATRQYARSLEPLGADVTTRGTSKRAVSRRFVAQTQAQLDAWRATPLDALDLVGLLIDGVHVGGHGIVVARGIDTMGAKHPLGRWEGATENATVCQGLLTNLGSRGLRTDRSLLVIVDGAKALDTAVTQTFGRAALVQRCQVHKGRNILEHLPEAQRPWVKAVLTRAYTNSHVKTAKRLLQDLARRLDTDYPSAATSVREGLDETLTVLGVGLSERLQRSLATTNAIESLLSRTRHVQRHVKRWRGGTMVLRWVAAGVLEAATGFRRVQGCQDMPALVAALRARDARLGLGESSEMVA